MDVGDDLMILDETERQDLLLHLLSKVGSIDGYSKFYNIMYLLKNDFNEELSDYEFNNQFLTIKDSVLDNDLNTLILQNFVNNDFIDRELAHQHSIKIKKDGLRHLKIQKIDQRLKEKIGKDSLRKFDDSLKKYNEMSINNVISTVKEIT